MEKIDNLDRKILEIITLNARIPFKDVAAECGVSHAAIHQRIQRLILSIENEDIRSLREMITYGLKGLAAYSKHANALMQVLLNA